MSSIRSPLLFSNSAHFSINAFEEDVRVALDAMMVDSEVRRWVIVLCSWETIAVNSIADLLLRSMVHSSSAVMGVTRGLVGVLIALVADDIALAAANVAFRCIPLKKVVRSFVDAALLVVPPASMLLRL